jgi:hypothetical protein
MTGEVSGPRADDPRATYEAPRALCLHDAHDGTGGVVTVICVGPGSGPSTGCTVAGFNAPPGQCTLGIGADVCEAPGSTDIVIDL